MEYVEQKSAPDTSYKRNVVFVPLFTTSIKFQARHIGDRSWVDVLVAGKVWATIGNLDETVCSNGVTIDDLEALATTLTTRYEALLLDPELASDIDAQLAIDLNLWDANNPEASLLPAKQTKRYALEQRAQQLISVGMQEVLKIAEQSVATDSPSLYLETPESFNAQLRVLEQSKDLTRVSPHFAKALQDIDTTLSVLKQAIKMYR